MAASMNNSTITNTTFLYDVEQFNIQDATIDRCNFNGEIIKASVTGELIKCKFEKLYDDIAIKGPLKDMTILDDICPSSAGYVLDATYPSKLNSISKLSIDNVTVPRLGELSHKECYISITNPGERIAFIVQLSSDDTNPSGVILMWSGSISEIPKGYVVCDGTNGTPDLTGKFIRMIDTGETVGDKPNSNLGLIEGTGRYNAITIAYINLPKHPHTLAIDSIDVSHNLTVKSYTDLNPLTLKVVKTITDGTVYGVEESEGYDSYNYSKVTSENKTISLTHGHDLEGDITIDNVTFLPDSEEYPNEPINIEPNAYALIFIMKL